MSQSFLADTDKLEAIADLLAAHVQGIEDSIREVVQCRNAIAESSWDTPGAAHFLAEMDELILPQMRMLHYFLTNTHRQVRSFIEQALNLEPQLDEIERRRPEIEAMINKMQARQQQMQDAAAALEARARLLQAQAEANRTPQDSTP